MELKAIKFGVSEHKRVNYLNFYFAAALSFSNLIGTNINEKEKIYLEFLNNKIYERKKKDIDISRELTFFKNKFKLYKLNKNNEIEVTNLTKKILENPTTKIFNGKTYLENALILYLIKQHPEKNIDNNPFFSAIKFAEEEKYEKKKFINKIFKLNKQKIKDLLHEIPLNDYINKYFTFGSGNPGVNKDFEKRKFQNKKDDLIKILAKNVFLNQNNEELILEKLYDLSENYKFLYKNKKIGEFPKVYKKLFNFNANKLEKFILNYKKNNKEEYLQEIREFNIDILIDNFFFENKKSDYENLIQKYLFLTNFFLIKKNKIILNNVYSEYINDLKKNYQFILNIELDDKNIINEFKKLNIKNNKDQKNISIREILDDYYNNDFYNDFFKIISKEDSKEINKELIKLGNKNEHINGILDAPTIFEFVINLFFFKLFYKNDLLNKKEINDEELTDKFKESINTYLTTNLIPQRFASGNRSDAIFKEQKILVEPTLETKWQVKHELNSIIKHLEKANYNISILVAPSIKDDFLPQVIAYKNYKSNYIILPFNTNILIKIKNSNYSEDLFNEIKNQFINCNSYNDVETIFQKYNN